MLLKYIGPKPKTISGFLTPEDKIPAEYFFDPCCEVSPEHALILLTKHPELFIRVDDPPPDGALGNPSPPAPVDQPKESSKEQEDGPKQKASPPRVEPGKADDGTRAASPQAEDGDTEIANEIIEAFYRLRLSGNQWRILWVIIRQTYGWKKKTDKISFSFFERKTGLHRSNIANYIKEMVERKIIIKNDTSFITTYCFQKDYTKWQLLPKMTTVSTQKELSSEKEIPQKNT